MRRHTRQAGIRTSKRGRCGRRRCLRGGAGLRPASLAATAGSRLSLPLPSVPAMVSSYADSHGNASTQLALLPSLSTALRSPNTPAPTTTPTHTPTAALACPLPHCSRPIIINAATDAVATPPNRCCASLLRNYTAKFFIARVCDINCACVRQPFSFSSSPAAEFPQQQQERRKNRRWLLVITNNHPRGNLNTSATEQSRVVNLGVLACFTFVWTFTLLFLWLVRWRARHVSRPSTLHSHCVGRWR